MSFRLAPFMSLLSTAEKCMFSKGDFSKISSCFLTSFEKIEQINIGVISGCFEGFVQVFCKDYLSTSCWRFYQKQTSRNQIRFVKDNYDVPPSN